MYCVAKYLNIDSAFLKKALGGGFQLSTSQVCNLSIPLSPYPSIPLSLLQTPQHQVPEMMRKLNDAGELFWPAGAFPAPVPSSNYGVCYTVGAKGQQLSFHVSSWKHLEHTV